MALPCHARKHRFGTLFFTSHVEFTDVFPFEPIRFTYLRYQTLNTCHQPKKRSKVRTHKLRAQQRKIGNQSFPMKTQGPDRRCGIPGLNQEFSTHTNTIMTVTHETWPLTIQFAKDDEAAQQPGWNFDHKWSPHLSHELHKHAKHFTAKLFIAKNTFTCAVPAVPQNGQKCVTNTGAVREDLPRDKYRRSRS